MFEAAPPPPIEGKDMTKMNDEVQLWNSFGDGMSPRQSGQELSMNHKRINYLCAKWSMQGIYDYGVCVDLGWKNPGAELPQ